MKWASRSNSGDYDDGAEDALHEECIPRKELLQYAFEHEGNAIREGVAEAQASDWFASGRLWFQVLNTVSRLDREELRLAILRGAAVTNPADGAFPESQMFAVATEVSKLLEDTAFSASCNVGEDLSWAANLIVITRAFRQILATDWERPWVTGSELRNAIATVGRGLDEGRLFELRADLHRPKGPTFSRVPNPARTPLHSFLADWIAEYLCDHRLFLDLAVCAECGTVFVRQRRDRAYCSVTCQNRVAYKRKRLLESGILREVSVDPKTPDALQAGLWLYHPRLGLGVVDSVRFERKARLTYEDGLTVWERVPRETTAAEYVRQLDAKGPSLGRNRKLVNWEEEADLESLETQVRFPHLSRSFAFGEIFPGKEAAVPPSFYVAEDRQKLAELL